jgi:cytochrome c biogenesis protein CcmG, thiol:disulfide interchange protein DsbE
VRHRAQWIFVGAVALALVATAVVAALKWGPQMHTVSVGETMPDFYAHTMAEPPVRKTFAQYRGRVVIVNVWATYCIPCRTEMPSLEHLYQTLAPKGLVVIGVSIDDPGQEPLIREFVKQYGLSFEILQEGTGHIEQLLDVFGVPATFVVGKDGIIRRKLVGASEWDSPSSRAMIERLLAQ